MSDLMAITEVARRSGVASSALRFYESRGLIASERTGVGPPPLSPRGPPAHRLHRLRPENRPVAGGNRRGAGEVAEEPRPRARGLGQASSAWTNRVDEQIAELQRLRAGVTQCIGCGCLSLQQCQLANPGDRVGRAGPGPRFWIGDAPQPADRSDKNLLSDLTLYY